MTELTSPELYLPHPQDRIHQGDVLKDLGVLVEAVPDIGLEPLPELATRDFAVILTQECDLEQDYKIRAGVAGESTSDKTVLELLLVGASRLPLTVTWRDLPASLPSILLASARAAGSARYTEFEGKKQFSSDQWKKVVQNKDERYQVLEPCAGLHSGLLIDFKQIFSVSTDYLYAALRRQPSPFLCSIAVPYREQISSRFAYFLSRVALPRDHTDPLRPAEKALLK